MEFELKVEAQQAQPVVFNYAELKEGLTTVLTDYKSRVYTEDMIPDAKKDKAKLNSLKKALSDERITRKKDFMKPFEAFEAQVKELCGMIDEATSGIDSQLEIYEQNRIAEKKEAIKSMFAEIASGYDINFITLEKVYNPKWENKTTTDKTIATEITAVFDKAINDLAIISKLPSYAFEATEVYKSTLDLNKAIAEGERMAKIAEAKKQAEIEAQRRAEEARLRAEEEAYRKAMEAEVLMEKATEVTPEVAEPTPEPATEPTYEFAFKVKITKSQAIALKDFCTKNRIELQKI